MSAFLKVIECILELLREINYQNVCEALAGLLENVPQFGNRDRDQKV